MNTAEQLDKGSSKISGVVKFTDSLINFISKEAKRKTRGHKTREAKLAPDGNLNLRGIASSLCPVASCYGDLAPEGVAKLSTGSLHRAVDEMERQDGHSPCPELAQPLPRACRSLPP